MNFQHFLETHSTMKKIVLPIYRFFSGLYFLILLMTGHIPSQIVRSSIYRLFGLKIGKNSYIFGKAEIRSPRHIIIGQNTIIGHNAILDGRGGLEIGNNVNLSSGVWIWTVEHMANDSNFCSVSERVIIEDYSWISCRTIILPGVRIGYGSVVCAGAVVTKNVEPYSIVAGVPAKKIGERIKNLDYTLGKPMSFV
jgi:maltose O-acetyltransferase